MSPDDPGGAAASRRRLRRMVVVVAAALLATGLGYPRSMGDLPFGLLLKNRLGRPAEDVALFWSVGTLAWYLKPLVALLCDSVPLWGSRRRGYMLLGSALASGGWFVLAFVPRSYAALLAVMVVVNLGLVLVSAAMGGVLVEIGQSSGATGRLSALRGGLDGLMALVTPIIGGWLATVALGWTAAVGALAAGSAVPVVLLLFKEEGREERRATAGTARDSARAAAAVLRQALSRPLLLTALFSFLVYVTPGLQTPLLFYRQDVLKMAPATMGLLGSLSAAGFLIGVVAYVPLCRRLSLRTLLVGGVAAGALSTLLFLGYTRSSAPVIDTLVGLGSALVFLPLLDLAARATPRGAESFGYAVLLAVQTFAQYGLSDVIGSYLYSHLRLGLPPLVWISAGSTAAVLLLVPLVPRRLLDTREARADAE